MKNQYIKRYFPIGLFGSITIFTMVCVFVPYTRHYFFLYDDLSQLHSVSNLSFSEIFQQSISGIYRPLGYIFWKTSLLIFGWHNAGAYSLVNLLAHCLSAFLLGLMLQIFEIPKLMCWLAASTFLCFSPMSEALFWMTGGHDVFGMPFFLLSILAAGLMLKAPRRKSRCLWGILVFLGNLFALLSKETAYVAFPLAFSLWFISRQSFRKKERILAAWVILFALSFISYLCLRSLFIPITQSHYGNPLEMFLRREVLSNVATNFKSLFAFGYFEEVGWITGLLRMGSFILCLLYIVSAVTEFYFTLLMTFTLLSSLAITGFTAIGPGSVVGGRLLYTPALILSIIIASGLFKIAQARFPLIRELGYTCICTVLLFQQISMRSFSNRFREGAEIARDIIRQIIPFTASPYIHVKNLPRFLYDGPHIMKCYNLPIYLEHTLGSSPQFRCDQVNLVSNQEGYWEIDSRVHDPYSQYMDPGAEEKSLELSFISSRTCEERDPDDCQRNLDSNKHPVFSIVHGCPQIDDILYTVNLNEAQMLTFGGGWQKSCSDSFEMHNLILYADAHDTLKRIPIYRCGAPGYHFISRDRLCKGRTVEGLLGYISTQPEKRAQKKMKGCFQDHGWKPHFDTPCTKGTEEDFLGYVELGLAEPF